LLSDRLFDTGGGEEEDGDAGIDDVAGDAEALIGLTGKSENNEAAVSDPSAGKQYNFMSAVFSKWGLHIAGNFLLLLYEVKVGQGALQRKRALERFVDDMAAKDTE
jgi:hypothetical protein